MILPLYGDPWFGPYRGDAVETKEKYLIEPVICYWLAEGHGARQRLHPGLSHRHSRARPPLIRREEVYRDQRGDGGPLCARHAGSRAWNTLKITDIVDQLRQQGEGIEDETLEQITILCSRPSFLRKQEPRLPSSRPLDAGPRPGMTKVERYGYKLIVNRSSPCFVVAV